MVSDVVFSSNKDDWGTPDWLFKACDDVFRFSIDAASSEDNHLLFGYYTQEHDGLKQPWIDSTWVNPPYGRGVTGKWVAKAAFEATLDVTSVLLLPSRTDLPWFHDYIYEKPDVVTKFIRGRVKFVGAKSGAPFPSMLVAFGPDAHQLEKVEIPWPR